MGEKIKDAETQRDMALAEGAKRSRQLAEARATVAARDAEVAKLKEAVSAEMAASEQAKARFALSFFLGLAGRQVGWGLKGGGGALLPPSVLTRCTTSP